MTAVRLAPQAQQVFHSLLPPKQAPFLLVPGSEKEGSLLRQSFRSCGFFFYLRVLTHRGPDPKGEAFEKWGSQWALTGLSVGLTVAAFGCWLGSSDFLKGLPNLSGSECTPWQLLALPASFWFLGSFLKERAGILSVPSGMQPHLSNGLWISYVTVLSPGTGN